MRRLVETDRWRDLFFVELHPNAKLLLSYLYDNADSAGFIDVNYSIFSAQLNMQKEFIVTSLKALQVKLLSDTKKKLFIKDFLRHQDKLPLVRGRKEDDLIIDKLESNLERFNNDKSITNILKNVKDLKDIEKEESKKGIRGKKFVPPEYNEFKEYALKEKPDVTERRIRSLYDHYISCGWKVGNKPMKDWQSAIRVNIHKEEKGYKVNYSNDNSSDKKTRTQTTLNVVEKLTKSGNNAEQ